MSYEQRFKSPEERFFEKVQKTGHCWLWKSAFTTNGYGTFWVGGKKRCEYAHRFSYMLHKGDIPDGMVVMHSCDNHACVNPDHLSLGTVKDNALDAKAKRRIAFGNRNGGGNSKLNDIAAQRLKIVMGAMPVKKICEAFGITQSVYKNIQRGSSWTHVDRYTKQALA